MYTNLLKILRTIGLKHNILSLIDKLSLWIHRIYVKVCFSVYFNFWEILTLLYIFAHNSKLILPQRASLAGVGSHMYGVCNGCVSGCYQLNWTLLILFCFELSLCELPKKWNLLFLEWVSLFLKWFRLLWNGIFTHFESDFHLVRVVLTRFTLLTSNHLIPFTLREYLVWKVRKTINHLKTLCGR